MNGSEGKVNTGCFLGTYLEVERYTVAVPGAVYHEKIIDARTIKKRCSRTNLT